MLLRTVCVLLQVMGCLSFCIATAILPMVIGMARAMSTFADATDVRQNHGSARNLLKKLAGVDLDGEGRAERKQWAFPIIGIANDDHRMRLQRAGLDLRALTQGSPPARCTQHCNATDSCCALCVCYR